MAAPRLQHRWLLFVGWRARRCWRYEPSMPRHAPPAPPVGNAIAAIANTPCRTLAATFCRYKQWRSVAKRRRRCVRVP